MQNSSSHRPFFLTSRLALLASAVLLTACGGDMPVEKAIIGVWVQDTPVSMSADQLQTTTSDTVLRLKKTGETQLSRVLKLQANGLPPEGIDLDIDLSGTWEQNGDKLIQTADTVIILPRTATPLASKWADQLQKQAEGAAPSIKIILAADKQQLILQDTVSGATDIYIRK